MLDAPSLAVGALLGSRYRIEARIGAGGMGVVYRAHDERLGRSVALKVVAQKGGASAVRRLQREARAVASLDHRGIAMLFDVVEAADVGVVLVMELVRGESLRAMLEEGPRSPREAADIVLDVAESLGAAHRAGLVHRDVKPDNIIVRPDGRTALLDFGIAKAITDRSEEAADPSALAETGDTTEGHVVGTPAYLAPEQAMASADISGATDQFALGVVAYELLTGASPWGAATTGAVLLAKIVGAEPPRPSALRPALGAPVDAVIARALQKDPAARFPAIEDLGHALVAAVAQAPGASARPPAAVRRLRPMAAPFAPRALPNADATTAAMPAPPSPSRKVTAVGGVALALALVAGAVAGTRALRGRGAAPPPVALEASAPAPPLAYADVPVHGTSSPDATRALRDAMLALRDADDALAERGLDAAIGADPAFGAARLQRAILQRRAAWSGGNSSQLAGHGDYVAAAAARDGLSPRDRALLEAFEPTFNLLPSDVVATEARLAALAATSPDAQLWNLLGRVRRQLESLDAAREAFDRELALDPQSAAALRSRAAIFTARGDLHGAALAYEQCFRTQPRAALCRDGLATVLEWNGECDAFVQRSREYAALAPDDTSALLMKLSADAFAGVPRAALDEELQSRGLSGLVAVNEKAWVHEIFGELGGAAALLANMEETAIAQRDAIDFAYARQARIVELVEVGQTAEATALAATYETRLATLPPLDGPDQLPYVLSVLHRAGKISGEELARRRGAWIDKWRPAHTTPQQRFVLWISAYARDVFSRDEGEEAVRALPAFVGELPPSTLFWLATPWSDREAVARALFFARHPRARSFVEDAARECAPSFYGIRNQLWSGLLFEREGDTAGACAAYARVVARWGHARPRSVTADAAGARIKALGCMPVK